MIIRIPLNTTHGVLSLILHYKGHPTNRFFPQKPPFTSGRQRVNPLLCPFISYLVGGFSPSEKYESQWEGLSHILWKIKNV